MWTKLVLNITFLEILIKEFDSKVNEHAKFSQDMNNANISYT